MRQMYQRGISGTSPPPLLCPLVSGSNTAEQSRAGMSQFSCLRQKGNCAALQPCCALCNISSNFSEISPDIASWRCFSSGSGNGVHCLWGFLHPRQLPHPTLEVDQPQTTWFCYTGSKQFRAGFGIYRHILYWSKVAQKGQLYCFSILRG